MKANDIMTTSVVIIADMLRGHVREVISRDVQLII